MRSGYREIGEFVQQVNIRNTGLAATNLQGISINKYFMPSVANINGTDLAKYKVVKQKQFAFNPMHVGRDEVLPIAMFDSEDSVIVSPAYVVFKVIDKQELLPEYLMMWCSRPEFDRNAWFTTDSSVRGGFSWDDFCALTLPVPLLEKQQKILKEYQVIVDRIKLNERLSQKLDETAQAIYKHWFVDFEFPMSAEYAASIGKPELEGQPYKSSGGEMVFNEVLEQEIPKNWQEKRLGQLLTEKGYIRGPFGSALLKEDMQTKGVPVYEQQHAIGDHRIFRYFIDDDKAKALERFRVQPDDCLVSCSGTLGKVTMIREKDEVGIINQALLILRPNPKIIPSLLLKAFLSSPRGYHSLVTSSGGSAQVNIAKKEIIENIIFILPDSTACDYLTSLLSVIDKNIQNMKQEILLLEGHSNILLSKLTMQN